MNVRLIAVLVGLGQLLFSQAYADVDEVRVWQSPDKARLVLDLSGAHEHRIFQLTNPDRIVIDLTGAKLKASLNDLDLEDTNVIRIRSGVQNKTDLRLVVETKGSMDYRSFPLPPNESVKHHRLVVDMEPRSGGAAVSAPVVVKEVKSYSSTKRNIIIAIDAGHGGEDPGAIGYGKTKEKQVVLAIAKELERLLRNELGYTPFMVRTGDYYLGLRERSEKARKANADLFVSIHADSFKHPSAKGSSVFVLSDRGATSETARYLAQKENSSDLVGGVNISDREDHLALTLLDLSMTAKRGISVKIGDQILGEMGKISKLHKNQVEEAAFMVLKSPDVPALLVETGFISNPDEAKKLATRDYQNRMARAIFDGIKQYFSSFPPEGTLIAAQKNGPAPGRFIEYIVRRGDTLSELAVRNGLDINSLRAVNGLASDNLRVGQKLRIPNT
ncbi:MAG: N-acetylmuramoyl-L-alanine amidase [Oleibacter sp.]|nr:N-acetylmuramoyl-L-alanine amidase [Thalassolituus sp.]